MKKFAVIFTVICCGLIVAPGVVASGLDYVAGSAVESGGRHIDIIALGTPAEAHGYFSQRSPVAHPHGRIHCLNVQGNHAAATGQLDTPVFGYTHFIVLLEDNGPPGHGSPDRWLTLLADGSELTPDCGFYLFGDGTFDAVHYTATRGNLIVGDR